ncbi:MAG: hypothetical protein KDA31_03970, partial [Phycisphaerales bacterium]|nr:hypothetical protein [Phycisphaerales bacterium]
MVEIVKYALILIAFINAAIVVVPYMLGKAELMTCRNFFLFGFTIYQVTSGVITIANPASYAPEITVSDQNAIAGQYLLWIIIFEIVFLACYRWGFGAKRLARFTPLVKGTPREPVLWIFAFALLGLALILRFTVLIPYVSVWTTHIGLSTAAVAAGLGAWIWVRRPLNPAAAALMFGVLIAALIINLAGFYGRRPIVAITGCLAWGTYYSRWRGLQPARVVLYAGVFGLIPVVLVAKYTAVRGQFQGTEAGGVARLTAMINADTKAGLMDLVSGQECAAWSMHLMEIYPEYYDYKHLHSIKYFVVFSVPRALWPEKPEPLATVAWRDAGIPGVPDGFSIGPGLLGHAAAEGGFYALIVYAAVFGLFVRYFDAILERAPTQPFIALPIGSSLGNLIGIPRGEAANFSYEFTVGVLGALIMLI